MRRQGAEESYDLPREYFLALRDALGSRLHMCVVEAGGEVISAGLFSESGGIVEYLYSGTDSAYLRLSPLKQMIHFVGSWARVRGGRWLHLGGGLGGGADDLYRFKAGFSSRHEPFHTLRMVIDPPAYQALAASWADRRPDHAAAAERYFPVYRAS